MVFESEEFFDADNELQDSSAAEVEDAPREMVATVSWNVPSDVEEDEDFNDPDDSAGRSIKMVLQLSTRSCSSLPPSPRLHQVSQISHLPHSITASTRDGHYTHLPAILHA